LAGGVIFKVLREELPEEDRTRFWPFLSGAVLVSLLSSMLNVASYRAKAFRKAALA
jgi:hypothetical protein